jgi:hypothetical protein
VRDNTEAVVSDAQIVVSSGATGLHIAAESNADGNYLIPALAAGAYKVSVTASGFKRYEVRQVLLRVG